MFGPGRDSRRAETFSRGCSSCGESSFKMINHFFSDLRHIGVCFLKCKPRRRVQGEKGLSAVYALGLQAHIPRIFFDTQMGPQQMLSVVPTHLPWITSTHSQRHLQTFLSKFTSSCISLRQDNRWPRRYLLELGVGWK